MQKELLENGFADIYAQPGDEPVFCFRFGNTVYEECFSDGMLVSAGWNCAGYPLNVLEHQPTRLPKDEFPLPAAFDVEADGRTLMYDWEYVGFEKEKSEGAVCGRVRLKNRLLPLDACVTTRLDGTAVMTRSVTLKNTGKTSMNINMLSPMCGGMEVIDDWDEYLEDKRASALYSVGYFGVARWAEEGQFSWRALPDAGYSISGGFRRDRHRHPFALLRNNALGNMFFMQLGWSAGYRISFELDADPVADGYSVIKNRSRIGFRIELDMPKPMLVLRPGEEYMSPQVHIGCIQGGLDDAVWAMCLHARKSIFIHVAPKGSKGIIEAGIGPAGEMTSGAFRHAAETASSVGAQTLIIDAGWYLPHGREIKDWWTHAGDWTPDADKYAPDLSDLRDIAHEKGLLFGVWMDTERIGKESGIFAIHPDWASVSWHGGQTTMLDMTNPEAAEWAESEADRIVTEYKADLFRLDYNIADSDAFARENRSGIDENCTVRYYEAVKAMYARLKAKHPLVIFENCAGGGGRTDLGFVANFDHTWVSDWQLAPRSFAITSAMTMVLPPERVDRLVSGMKCHTRGSLDFQVRQTLFGRPTTNTYNPDGSAFNPGQLEFVRRSFDLYKEYVLPYIDSSRVFHHTPELSGSCPRGVGILERADASGRAGILGVFALASPMAGETVVFPRGVKDALRYEVSFDNERTSAIVSGYELKQNGVRVSLDGGMSSELIAYKAIGD